jgi:ribonuclease HII
MSYLLTAGVDEAGRGPLAGSVVAAAVILPEQYQLPLPLRDSKKLSQRQRALLFPIITEIALSFAIASASVEEIDRLNILQASLLAMQRAIDRLTLRPEITLIDGPHAPLGLAVPYQCIIKGDQKIAAISAASILAKHARDQSMLELDARYPQYGFKNHKGYGTRQHLKALALFGPCPAHRQSFAPVRNFSPLH